MIYKKGIALGRIVVFVVAGRVTEGRGKSTSNVLGVLFTDIM